MKTKGKKTWQEAFEERTERQGIAYHEAGHAVWAYRLNLPLMKVTVKRRGRDLGETSYRLSTKEYYTKDMGRAHVAGSVAQDLFFDEDLHDIGCGADKQRFLEMDDPKLSWEWVKDWVKAEMEENPEIWAQIEDVAEALLKRQTLTSEQVARICKRTRRTFAALMKVA